MGDIALARVRRAVLLGRRAKVAPTAARPPFRGGIR